MAPAGSKPGKSVYDDDDDLTNLLRELSEDAPGKKSVTSTTTSSSSPPLGSVKRPSAGRRKEVPVTEKPFLGVLGIGRTELGATTMKETFDPAQRKRSTSIRDRLPNWLK
jgi:hypothetical protein